MTIAVRPLPEVDLDAADRIFRVAFGTFIGRPDPASFGGDTDYVRTRWRANRSGAFGAYLDGDLVGSNFATNWGTVGFFGPLTVRPDLWNRGIAQRLMEPVVACFDEWGVRHAGLFTFAHSQKHVRLYQRFGFWPRFLTALMSLPLTDTAGRRDGWRTLSGLPPEERERQIAECRAVTESIYPGLDVSAEIRAVAEQRLGDTVLLSRGGRLSAFAVCHAGAGSEAGSGACYVKFAAVRPSGTASDDFDSLLEACRQFARDAAAGRLSAGVNTARHEAYARLVAAGFRTDMQGVAMERPNDAGYNRSGIYVLDDWR